MLAQPGHGQNAPSDRESHTPPSDFVTEETAFDQPLTHLADAPSEANPVQEEVRWLRVPDDLLDGPLPIEAEPMPPIGRQTHPELASDMPLEVIVSDENVQGDTSVAASSESVALPVPGADNLSSMDGAGPEPTTSSQTAPGNGTSEKPREQEDLLQPEFVANKPSIAVHGPHEPWIDDLPGATASDSTEAESILPEDFLAEPSRANRPHQPSRPVMWHRPSDLLDRIERLAEQKETEVWASAVAGHIKSLGLAVQAQSSDTQRHLEALDGAVTESGVLAGEISRPARAAELQRAAHALRRRLDLWQYAIDPTGVPSQSAANVTYDRNQLALCLTQVDEFMGESAVGQAWREYLLIDGLRQWTAERQAEDDHLGRELARASLERLTRIPMDPRQRHFVTNEPVDDLKTELQRLAAAPFDVGRFLENLEQYEQMRMPSDARRLTRDYRRLALADSEPEQALAGNLALHYRNANLRFAVAESLLNKLMPTQEPEYAPVNDIVLGIRAHGQRATSTDVQVSLIPDPERARLALDVYGRIFSQTTSNAGPATFLTNSLGWYVARKPLELNLDGIGLSPAEVRVSNDLRLRDVHTDFDRLPLFGSLVNHVARSQHAQNRPAANAEIQAKIYHQAKSRIDQEADERLTEVSDRLRTKLLEPMRRLRLDPVMIDAETTEDRFNMRIRLAGEDQLGSHTPRPRAPSDSLASVQVHESAINNVLNRLDLDGRTFTLPELSRHVAGRLNNDGWLRIGPEHEEITITFVPENAVLVRCEDGQMSIMLRIERFQHQRRVWRDFQVQAFYQPNTEGISARLDRDGVIQLSGDRLPLGSQIALRGIFVRIFARGRSWELLPPDIAGNPNLAGLEVTQFIIEDGWVGVALGPQRTANRIRRLLR